MEKWKQLGQEVLLVTSGYVSIYNEEMTYADDVRISLTL